MLARHRTTLKFRMFWSFELSFFFLICMHWNMLFSCFLMHDYMIFDTGVVTTPSSWIPKDSITPKLSPFALLQSYFPQPFWQCLMENHGPHFEFQDSYEETFLTLHFSAANFPFVLSFFDPFLLETQQFCRILKLQKLTLKLCFYSHTNS